MPRNALLAAVLSAAACLSLSASAQAPTLVHLGSVYADGKAAALKAPEGIACNDAGLVVVADTANARLVRFEFKDGGFGPGTPIALPAGTHPTRLDLDAQGNLLVLDTKERRLVRVSPDGTAAPLELRGIPGATAFRLGAFRADPRGGDLYLLDTASSRVVVANSTGEFQRQVELTPGLVLVDLAVDDRQRVLALDAVTGTIYASPRATTAFKPAGKPLKQYMNFGGYLEATANGRFWVVDRNGHGLVSLGPDLSYQGRQLSIGWTEGLLFYPGQICATTAGDVFVADVRNHRVQAFGTPR